MNSTKEFILWPIPVFGFEDGDDANDGDNNDDANDQQQEQDSSDDDSEDDAEDDDLEGLSAKELRRIAADREKARKAAEAKATKAAKDAAAKEREKLNADQKKDFDLNQANETIAKLTATNTKLALLGAIRDDSRFEWHNPEIVAQQLNSEIVKVDSEGRVEGLANELKRVSKDHAYLLKKKGQQQDSGNNNGNNNNNQQQNNQQSGLQPGQGGANQGGSMPPQQAELVELMPALRSRM
jgi:hypothetical protein